MRLLIYSHFFTPSVGGVENAVISLARGLAEMRGPGGEVEFQVTVVTLTEPGDFDDAALPFRVFRRPSFVKLLSLVRHSHVVHVAGPSLAPLALAYFTRTPMVIEHHGYQSVCLNGLLLQQPGANTCPGYFQQRQYAKCVRCFAAETTWPRAVLKLLTMFPRQFITRKADVNIAISGHVMNRQRLPRTEVIYYGIQFPSLASNETLASPSSRTTFAYVGRFVQEKGVAVLLRAAALLQKEGRSFSVLLIGDGEQRAQLEELLHRENLRDVVRITGYLHGDQLAAEFRHVDVLVMPSLCEETAGLAAIEQMVRGRLVIASAIGGLAEIVEGAGVTFPAGDVVALAGRMREVIDNPAQFQELTLGSQIRARELFRVQRMIDEHASVYRRVAGAALNQSGN